MFLDSGQVASLFFCAEKLPRGLAFSLMVFEQLFQFPARTIAARWLHHPRQMKKVCLHSLFENMGLML